MGIMHRDVKVKDKFIIIEFYSFYFQPHNVMIDHENRKVKKRKVKYFFLLKKISNLVTID